MAKVTIRMVDTAEGPLVTVDYESEPDALGHEHERDHRAAVAKLMGLSVAELEALGVRVVRGEPVSSPDDCGCEPDALLAEPKHIRDGSR